MDLRRWSWLGEGFSCDLHSRQPARRFPLNRLCLRGGREPDRCGETERNQGSHNVVGIRPVDVSRRWKALGRRAGHPPAGGGTLDVVRLDKGYVALGQGPNGVSAIWKSRDGQTWELVSDDATFDSTIVEAIAVHDGQVVAVGGTLTESGPSPAVAWRSTDAVHWERIVLSGADSGNAFDIAASESGFTAVGPRNGAVMGAVAWQSSDGRQWREIVLSRGNYGATFVGAAGDSFVALGGGSWQKGGCPSQAWSIFSSVQGAIPLNFDGEVVGLVGYRDRYIGIGTTGCGPFGYSSLSLIFGLPPGANQNVRLGESP